MSFKSLPVTTLGVPRIGSRRELKFALESYWSGKSDASSLLETAARLRAESWARQAAAGVANIPSNDFSLYDHVLDTSVMVGAIPDIYGWKSGEVALDVYFAMARGSGKSGDQTACGCGPGESRAGAPAQEMTKWFDTNYHFMVPEFTQDQAFTLASQKPLEHFLEAKSLGHHTRPVLLGPVTYLRLGKSADADFDPLSLLDRLLPVYAEILGKLSASGADWVQMDEPCLVLDMNTETRDALRRSYAYFAEKLPEMKIMLATYFGGLGDDLDLALNLPVSGVHLDLVRAPEMLETAVSQAPHDLVLSLGVIDGRNVWRADLERLYGWLKPVIAQRADGSIELAPSCSMLHVPIDLDQEIDLDPDVKEWLAFSVQKIEELVTLATALKTGPDAVAGQLSASRLAADRRKASPKVHDPAVTARLRSVTPDMGHRHSAYAARARVQRDILKLPLFPTTTIGSFPQTAEVRKARAAHTKQQLSDTEYASFLRKETEAAIHWQEEIGLDVLVHGEFERNDMVQYFGEKLSGFAFTKHGWVQSYGSRYVRPPILFGDVSRPHAMTVDWWNFAQSCTEKPVKGMLTGPVTILNWSFVRDDIPRRESCRQIALAIRDEVADLEKAGAKMIQIDEAALREGLPLKTSEWKSYLDWAVDSFRLCASGVADATQIHTHMCYSEFNDIIAAIADMDADVISIETSRSKMELLDAFLNYQYPNEIGPGVYDIHSPRIPGADDMSALIKLAKQRLTPEQLWVNPDCGLKTRRWEEVRPALVNMVAAAKALRADRV
tara:strand:- start:9202 stop:11544 length:2343 start_codon:yes stop_codon:yes gene_type:complete